MPRIQPVQPTEANEKSKKLLEGVQRGMGMVPNMFKTLAQSSAALAGYLNFNQALSGALTPAQREQIALAVAGVNGCDYCASAHTLLGSNAGISGEELTANLVGQSSDNKTQAGLTFAIAVVERHGRVTDDDLELIKAAGFTDAQIVEIVAVVALNIFTNYFNHVADTEIDFPFVDTVAAAAS
ncbi:carboxymuconolactone decarboxylase family protein [Thalassoroseus pseudoceratinae]|uniref:carboxymuconolactone decarboxylase family protein n=1 Tax=Thalassoroseus pseudoceratinae TaxID=2713176 RepID=UPI00141F4D58|nr:peroxidase-related enzyme [Thalassoroseus pseudoceratinae]